MAAIAMLPAQPSSAYVRMVPAGNASVMPRAAPVAAKRATMLANARAMQMPATTSLAQKTHQAGTGLTMSSFQLDP